ncbi:MAG: hypothetical protein KatS3mg077_2946 [Candidatus Binatia bacterium]|nr:MAG: hypothetical protein KatS3mg077_2946 [Candidatus Binatia bacterium]
MKPRSARRFRQIKDVFYETRVLMGREYTIRRFAREVLGGVIDPVMLSYIESGKRFPSEALVRRLAAIRGEDPQPLLALLWRDRMLYAFGKELRRVLSAPREIGSVSDAELAVRVSEAIAALPDDGSWISLARWRRSFRDEGSKRAGRRRSGQVSADLAEKVESLLRERGLVEVAGSRVRRLHRHYVAEDREERMALATEFCALFVQALMDKLALAETEAAAATYLRNHFLHIEMDRWPEFRKRLDDTLRALAEEFAADPTPATRFLNVLVVATTM